MQIEPGVVLEEAEGVALKSLDEFSDEEKAFYDFNFTLKQNSTENSDGFIINDRKYFLPFDEIYAFLQNDIFKALAVVFLFI